MAKKLEIKKELADKLEAYSKKIGKPSDKTLIEIAERWLKKLLYNA